MQPHNRAKEILKHLIRNRFDRLNTYGLLTLGPDLIHIARDAGLDGLAAEMEQNLKQELPPQAHYSSQKAAA
jgi:hypothetical protein